MVEVKEESGGGGGGNVGDSGKKIEGEINWKRTREQIKGHTTMRAREYACWNIALQQNANRKSLDSS